MSRTEVITSDVARMRAEIARLTGRVPASTSVAYLTSRLNDLLRAKQMHVALPEYVNTIVAECAMAKRCSSAELVRRALAYYVRDHMGRVDDAARIAESTRGE